MSATDKEPQPLGSTSGKRGYIRTCVRCGVTLYGVGRRAKYCPECRADVNREAASATKQLICQRCGQSFDVSSAGYARAKYCPACRPGMEAEQRAARYERKKSARTFAGPYMTNPRPADVTARAAAKAQVGEDRLRLLSNVADWAGISYGQLMLKSPAAREALILDYKAAKGGTP